jgi:AcrR family transcriptional regulator
MSRTMRADARRHREQLLTAARDVLTERGAGAPLEAIARQARVGIGTLYRRFPDRRALLRAVVLDVLAQTGAAAAAALEESPDAFGALARYMHAALDIKVAAVIPALMDQVGLEDPEMRAARDQVTAPVTAIIDAAHAEGSLRPEVTFGDIGLLVVRLAHPLPGPIPADLGRRLAHRHLDLVLAGLRVGSPLEHDLDDAALTLQDLHALGRNGDPLAAAAERETE